MNYLLNRRKVLAGLGAMTLLLRSGTAFAQATSVRIGTSSVGSVFYILGVGASEIIRKYAGINTTAETVGGSAANVNGIGSGNVDLAISNSFAAYSGYTGTYAFEGRRVDLRLMMQGNASHRGIFVRNGAGIKTAKDLEGKTVIGERRSLPELRLIMDALIEHYKLDASTIKVVATTNQSEAVDALRIGSVDAAIMPYSRKAANIETSMKDGFMSFMKWDASDRDAVLKKLPSAFFGVTQPANDFSNQPEETPLVALNAYMIASPSVDDDTAYAIAKAMFENNEKFISYHSTGRFWTLENAVKNPALPFHDGVIRYFKEVGAWSAENEEIQARLLKL